MIRVLIADDFELLRDVIRLYLDGAEDITVIDEAPDLDDALQSAGRLLPDVIIMNDYLPPIDSAHAAALFRELGITCPILIISMQLEPALVAASFLNGAKGIMQKDEIDDHLVEAVRHIHQGQRYFSPRARAASITLPG
jgi:DNA-binding NarL/FixJ family response regulator